ncbi:lipoprotein-releasing system permease protein [Roseivirga ehrenbergii]|uniref:ABC transporter permease n=1 Tax=Roseivirga ehrenbergii (strain DSM 102268 / JCM 13514 / KCTC 12282 / NCIMB 14502 / KMM 6017) TaxID=279360 RepID=UPI000A007DF7|nr:FtsX-like permease family protein [Roseivirga ehrenbergii]TCL10571.1 lipoprotein-releasing system permease protein [Roseivirga ehrenbergii]
MNLSSFIAKRYFASKKKKNFIQVLSWISVIGVAIGTAALIVVLSVFNGLQDFVRSVYNSFDAPLTIQASVGKSFEMTPELRAKVESIEGVNIVTEVIEDNALILFQDQQVVAKIKGVDSNYASVNRLDTFLVRGKMKLKEGDINYAILGTGVAYNLSLRIDVNSYGMQIVYPKKLRPGMPVTNNSITRKSIVPAAIFNIEPVYNESYVFVPLSFAQDLMDYENKRTSIELYLDEGVSINKIKEEVSSRLGDGFEVLDSDELHSSLLKAIKIEKLFAYITLSFIMAIASFNIFFTLSMLAIEKKRDISVLYSFGATAQFIRQIFLKQGSIISLVGSVIGLLAGLALCLLQQKFGLVSMGMQSAVMNAYPVKLEVTDFIMVGVSIFLITILISYRPAIIASRVETVKNLN